MADHLNGNRMDNRWANLREADVQMNVQNVHKPKSVSKTGVLGIYRSRRRFGARIWIAGTRVDLGAFDTPAQAHGAYVNAKRKFHRGNML